MNKLWLLLHSTVLVSCQLLPGNVPETRDLSTGQNTRSPASSSATFETEISPELPEQERHQGLSRDLEALIEGTYLGPSELHGSGCSARRVEFKGNLVQLREIHYLANICEGRKRGEIRTTGRIRIGAISNEDAMKRALDIDVIRIEAQADIKSWGLSRKQLSPDPCGILIMNGGETRNLTGADCRPFGRFPKVGETYYTSISINSGQTIGIPFFPNEWNREMGHPEKRWTSSQEEFIRQDKSIQR